MRRRRERYQEESEYFLSRATNYVNMFDPAVRFFQGRAADGTWKSSPREYDPREWGHEHDYTETDGWGFAFHAPQDGQGLANLYGGRDGLAAKLDEFFATPETAKFVGSYGGTIHEMIEARDVRMGQWGFSNQVSHHIPYMYDYAGQPAKTQEKVREALRRLYLGSEIGQGYAGDEDNGETSAWYLFSALGFYPLQMGSPYYAIGSPLFKKATVHLGRGRDLVVRARNNSPRNVYVQGLRLNGRRYDRTYLRHEDIAHGGTLEFDMGPRPSRWGAQNRAAVADPRRRGAAAAARRDRLGHDVRRAAVRRRLEHERRRERAGDGRLRGRAGGELLHAHLGGRRGCRPARLDARGLERRAALAAARHAPRRDVPLAPADAAVQGRASRLVPALPARPRPASSRRSSCSTARRSTSRRWWRRSRASSAGRATRSTCR